MGRSRDQLRFVVAAFGDAGHAFPAIALARELQRRGHEVLVESWEKWQGAVEGEGLRFEAAQQYMVFPPPGPDTPQGQIVARAARALAGLMGEFEPDLVVSDILTRAPALAAEVAGVPGATLIPHVYPVQRPGQPMYSMGFQPARTPLGRAGWRATMPLLNVGLRQGRDELNETRERLGLAPQDRFHGGISELLAIVATFPQLEYPRVWPPYAHVSGPLFFELPTDGVEIPDGEGPLVVIAPSTAQDPECEMLRAALEGLAEEPVRVLATTNRRSRRSRSRCRRTRCCWTGCPIRRRWLPRTLSSRTGGTGRWCGRCRWGRRCWSVPPSGTWARTGRASRGRARGCPCRGGCCRRGESGWRRGGSWGIPPTAKQPRKCRPVVAAQRRR